jgi:hypothetical protein
MGQFADLGSISAWGKFIDYRLLNKNDRSQGRVTITDGPYADKMEVDVILDTSKYRSSKRDPFVTENYSSSLDS